MCLHTNYKVHMACYVRFIVKSEGVLEVTGSCIYFKSGISVTVLDSSLMLQHF